MPTLAIAADRMTNVTATNWQNPSNAYSTTANGVYATITSTTKNLNAQSSFGFPAISSAQIPDGATIAEVRAVASMGATASVTGLTLGVNIHNPDGTLAATEVTKNSIAQSDMTVTASTTPTLSDLRVAGQIRVRCRYARGNTTVSSTAQLDFVRLEVDYTEPIAAVTGSGAVTAGAPTVAGSGTHTLPAVTGTAAVQGRPAAVSASGEVVALSNAGTVSVTAPAPTASGTGTHTLPAVTGSASVVAAGPQTASAGSLRFLGTGDASVLGPEASGSGGVLIPVSGTASVNIPAPSALGAGVVGGGLVGTAAVTIPAPVATSSGLLRFTGTATGMIPAPTATADGAWELDITGTGALTAQAPYSSGTGMVAQDLPEPIPGSLPRPGRTTLELAHKGTAVLTIRRRE